MGYRCTCSTWPDTAALTLAEQPTTRSFLACWPDTALVKALAGCSVQMQSQVGGRAVTAENLHITLAFLGNLTATQMSAAINCCAPLPKSFTITLDRIGFWKNRGLVWVGPRQPNLEFDQFVEDLRDKLRRLGFRVDRRSFVPPITLLRKARKRPRATVTGLDWIIQEYTLCSSELRPEGSRYSVLNRWSTI